MNSQAPRLPMIHDTGGTRSRLIRRARTLSLLSIAWISVPNFVIGTVIILVPAIVWRYAAPPG